MTYKHHYIHFSDEATEVNIGKASCPRSQGEEVTEPRDEIFILNHCATLSWRYFLSIRVTRCVKYFLKYFMCIILFSRRQFLTYINNNYYIHSLTH